MHNEPVTAAPRVYISFPGTAEQALRFYASVVGGDLVLHSFENFGRTDGPATAIAHGELTGTISLGGADVADGEPAVQVQGLLLSLLGTADPPSCTGGSTRSPAAGRSSTRWRPDRGVRSTVRSSIGTACAG